MTDTWTETDDIELRHEIRSHRHGELIRTGDDDPLYLEVRADDHLAVVHIDAHLERRRRIHLSLDSDRARGIAGLLAEQADRADSKFAVDFTDAEIVDLYTPPDRDHPREEGHWRGWTTGTVSLKDHPEWAPYNLPAGVIYTGQAWNRGGWRLLKHQLANPWTGNKHGSLYERLARYADHVQGRPDLMNQVAAMAGFTLACHCPAGAPCHNRVVVALADGRPDLIPGILEAVRGDSAPAERLTPGTPPLANAAP